MSNLLYHYFFYISIKIIKFQISFYVINNSKKRYNSYVATFLMVAGVRLELTTFGLWVLVVIISYLFIFIYNCLYLPKYQHFSIYTNLYLCIFIHIFGRQLDVLSSRKLYYFSFIFATPLFSFFDCSYISLG